MGAIKIEKITEYKNADLADLVQATEDAIRDGIGFNWVIPPEREVLEKYWEGVLMVSERVLFAGRLDNTIAGSVQLIQPGASKETTAFCAQIEAHFVAPWARGHGLAKALLDAAEREARMLGFSVLRLSVRETQEAAIKLYEESGYKLWGTLPYYEFVSAKMIPGRFYYKQLEPLTSLI